MERQKIVCLPRLDIAPGGEAATARATIDYRC